ncbi:MAG: HAMP domain-containing histidine kinase [Planctomycetes bacterium]|nr:HAMP domain-containing histidine kinase [Planctomycetota bacterium]
MSAGPRRLAGTGVALVALGAVVLAGALVASASDARASHAALVASERARAATAAAAAFDDELRRTFRELSRFGSEVGSAWLHASEPVGSRREAAGRDAAFAGIRALVEGPTAPPGVRVVLYDAAPEDAPEPFVLLGVVERGRVRREGLAAWPGRVPPALQRREADAPGEDGSGDVGWFGAEGEDAARLHQHALYTHSYEDDDQETSVVRAVEVSVPVRVPDGLAVTLRCDVVDGAADRALPRRPAPGGRPAGPDDVEGVAASPELVRWRFAVDDPAPRATVRAVAPVVAGAGAARPVLWLSLAGALVAAGLALVGVASRRRRDALSPPPDVTAEAAHELKTPLTAMRGAIEVALRRERSPAEYRDVLASTLEEVKGLQNVVGSVLLLTRGAETPPAREPVDLVALVRGEAERVHAAASDRDVSFASVRGPRVVVGDPSLLARAVGNLVDNAHLHSVAGGAIRVRLEVVDAEAIVSVEDDGPGIPSARREKVFERFWRGPEVGARGIPGAGLGLPIARWIAQLHGGRLDLDPALEGRSRFVLRLPLAPS